MEEEIVKVGKKVIVSFKHTGILKDIKKMKSSCGCAKPKYSKVTKELKVAYVPKAIPPQRLRFGNYRSIKKVTITYIDGTKEVLEFESLVTI